MSLLSKQIRMTDFVGKQFSDERVHIITNSHRAWPLMGIVLDDEALLLDFRTFTSFRVRSGNLGFIKGLKFLRINQAFDKDYLKEYFKENNDNPYGLYNVMGVVNGDLVFSDLTQFPPLNTPRKDPSARKLAIDRLVAIARKGDSIFSGNYFDSVSGVIRKYDKTQFSHTAMYVGDSRVVDIGPGGASINSLYDTSGNTTLALYRLKDELTKEQQEAVAARSLEIARKCRMYNWVAVFFIFLNRRFGLPVGKDLLSNADLLYSNRLKLICYV